MIDLKKKQNNNIKFNNLSIDCVIDNKTFSFVYSVLYNDKIIGSIKYNKSDEYTVITERALNKITSEITYETYDNSHSINDWLLSIKEGKFTTYKVLKKFYICS